MSFDYRDDEELADFIDDGDVRDIDRNPDRDSNRDPKRGLGRDPDSVNRDSREIDFGDSRIEKGEPRGESRGEFAGAADTGKRILQAHISVLVSALGGPDHSTPGAPYKLGHDALACLKDLKRWLRSVDERNGSFDVALACSECRLVPNDLAVILCQWQKPPRLKSVEKVMLASLELLVLLTWPIDVNRRTLMKDYAPRTNARRAQLLYKHHLLTYRDGLTIKAVVGLGLPALTKQPHDREPRDINILRLIVFFLRNILYIEPLPPSKAPKGLTNSAPLPLGLSADDISLNVVITAFHKNNALLFLSSIAHSVLATLFDDAFGSLLVECLSLLTRGIKVLDLIVPAGAKARAGSKLASVASSETSIVAPASTAAGLQLNDLLTEESNRKKLQKNTMATRHGRFGSLLSIQNPSSASSYTVSGQEALASTHTTLDKLDRSKKWHKPSSFRYDANEYLENNPVHLSMAASTALLNFVNQFLLSGCFNNVVRFAARSLTSASNDHSLGRGSILEAIDGHELAAYFLSTAWFLRFKRERAAHYTRLKTLPPPTEDSTDYGSVGAALSEVHFVLLVSYFRAAFDAKDYDALHVAMICFREMLLISHAVFILARSQREIELDSPDDVNEDRELAEGIIRKLFSQKHFLDMVINVPKQAAKHSPEYLNVVVATVHILLKCFEALANEDVKLFIQTRRKMSKLNRPMNSAVDSHHWHLIGDTDSLEPNEEDEAEIKYITQERKLDFNNTEVRFFHAETVSTHIAYLSRFEDLTHEEIKRGISFFHRLFVVRKDYSALYRLDFMSLILRLRNHLPRGSSIRSHVEEFIVYFMKKFKGALERFPLPLEVLFPRMENLELKAYLSTGDVEAKSSTPGKSGGPKKPATSSYFSTDAPQPRAAPLLRFSNDSASLDEKIGALLYHMMKKPTAKKLLKFILSELSRLKNELDLGSTSLSLRLNLANRKSMINDGHLRLLVDTIGFDLPFLQNDDTVLRKGISAHDLSHSAELIEKWIRFHEGPLGDVEPFLDQIHPYYFSEEQLQFGQKCFSNLRIGAPVDEAESASLGLNDDLVYKLVGLARRKDHDETFVPADYGDDDENEEFEDDEDDENDKNQRISGRSRKRRARFVDSDDEEEPKEKKVKKMTEMITKSAEMVNDSDDESDDERVNKFFDQEQKLRDLIQKTGGIVSKEQLEIFKDSWKKIITTNSGEHVKEAIEKAASLFVNDSDDEDVSVSRKRAIIDDD